MEGSTEKGWERGRRAYREIEKCFFFGKEFDTCKIYNYPCKTLLYIRRFGFLNKPNQATNYNKNCTETVRLFKIHNFSVFIYLFI